MLLAASRAVNFTTTPVSPHAPVHLLSEPADSFSIGSGLAGGDGRLRLCANAGILDGDAVDDRGHIARKIGQTHPINAVARAAIVNDRLPLRKSRGRGFGSGAGLGIWTVPARPFFAGVFGVAATGEEFDAGIIRMRGAGTSGRLGRRNGRGTPPLEAAPLRKELGVKGMVFECAFRLVVGAHGKNFSGVGCAQEDFSGRIAADAGDLRGTCFRELSENAAAVNGEKRTIVARAGEETAVGG